MAIAVGPATAPNKYPVLTLSLLAGAYKSFIFPNFEWSEVTIRNRTGSAMRVASRIDPPDLETDATAADSFEQWDAGEVQTWTREDAGPEMELFFRTVGASVVQFRFSRLGANHGRSQ